ncbi:Ig-like domain-containing protein [Belliella aquatica]|nr:Ig-like domain-containing protein [Belliella aquatica]MCH7404612.1 Ig-like domain-containing protein [Belliella aquatica]
MKSTCLLVLIAFFISIIDSKAATYYFSSTAGNDSRTAAQAQSENTPWQSIEKLNNIMGSLSPGDRILFKRGEVFYGSIRISKSGNSGAPIVFSTYGNGAKPILTSMSTVSNWTSLGNGIFVSDLQIQPEGRLNILTVDDEIQELGRFPNFNDGNKGFKTITSTNGGNQITSNDFSNSENWLGGEIVIRKNPWVHDRHIITANSSNSVSFNENPSKYSVAAGYGFFIQNHIKTLDQFGEWFHDKSAKKLYVYLGNPTNLPKIEISTKNNLIQLNWGISHIQITDLELKGANSTGIIVNEGNHVYINNSDIKFMGENAIKGTISNYLRVENCTIDQSLNNALYVENTSQNVTIKNNLITNTYLFVGMGLNGDLNGKAIYTSNRTHNGTIENNRIFNTGYIGINFGGDNSVVRNNYVKDFCIHKTDGGGIYLWEGGENKNSTGRVIENNVIINGIGYSNGTNKHGLIDPIPVEGIYVDDNASGVLIQKNTIANISKHGIYLHNARNINVFENIIYNAFEGIYLNHDQYGDPVRNISIVKNEIFAIQNEANFINTSSIKEDEAQMGSFNNNYFIRPFGNDFGFLTKYLNQQTWEMKSHLSNIKWWNKDQNAKNSPLSHPEFKSYESLGANLFGNGKFDSNSNHTFCNNCSVQWKNSGAFNNGHLFVAANKGGELNFTLEKSKIETSYLLKFKIKGNKSGFLEIFLREGQSPWRTISNSKGIEIGEEVQEFQIPINSKIETSKFNLIFKSGLDNLEYSVDDIEITEANIEFINPDEYLFFEYNATSSSQKFPLSGEYVDANNTSFSGSVDIPAFSAKVLIKVSLDEIQEPIPPTISILNPSADTTINKGGKIKIASEAKSEQSEIQKVEYYLNDILIKTVNSKPYEYEHLFEELGEYSLYAKAVDQNGLITNSQTIPIKVVAGMNPPIISWLTPSHEDFFFASDPIKMVVLSENEQQNIVKIDFSIDNNVVGTVNNAPYEITLPNLPLGTHHLVAKATNSDGLTGDTEVITITIIEDAKTPLFKIISPDEHTQYIKDENLIMNIEVLEGSSEINKVEYYRNDIFIGSRTGTDFELSWIISETGNVTIEALATDVNGKSTAETQVISVSEKPTEVPIFKIVSPVALSEHQPGTDLKVQVEIPNSNKAIESVEFYDGNSLLGKSNTLPYDFILKELLIGEISLIARLVYQDGTSLLSLPVKIFIKTGPSVELITEQSRVNFSLSEKISFNPKLLNFSKEIISVNYFANGTLIGTSTISPFSFEWETSTLGTQEIWVEVIDIDGKVFLSPKVVIQIIENENQDPLNLTEFKFGPNPTTRYLNLYFADIKEIHYMKATVSSMDGKNSKTFDFVLDQNEVTLDLQGLKRGNYLLRVIFEGQIIITKKFMKRD